MALLRAALIATVALGCDRSPPVASRAPAPKPTAPLLADLALPTVDATSPNGENDGSAEVLVGPGLRALAAAERARWVRVGAPPRVHPRVCDLVPHAGALYRLEVSP